MSDSGEIAEGEELAVGAPDPADQAPALHSRENVRSVRVKAPTRGNRKLEKFLDAVNRDDEVKAWWYMAQTHAERLGMSDHSWVHMQIVLNIALRLTRLLDKGGVHGAMVTDHGMSARDTEVVVAGGALLHDVGMSIHRADHEEYSLFLAREALPRLLDGIYEEPEKSIVMAEVLHAIIGHRRRGQPYTVEAGIVRVADALDMAEGRTRVPLESGQEGIHSISAAAIDRVNQDLSVIEKVRQFAFADEAFGIENEEMTPSLKIRRHKLKERYGERLDGLYKG